MLCSTIRVLLHLLNTVRPRYQPASCIRPPESKPQPTASSSDCTGHHIRAGFAETLRTTNRLDSCVTPNMCPRHTTAVSKAANSTLTAMCGSVGGTAVYEVAACTAKVCTASDKATITHETVMSSGQSGTAAALAATDTVPQLPQEARRRWCTEAAATSKPPSWPQRVGWCHASWIPAVARASNTKPPSHAPFAGSLYRYTLSSRLACRPGLGRWVELLSVPWSCTVPVDWERLCGAVQRCLRRGGEASPLLILLQILPCGSRQNKSKQPKPHEQLDGQRTLESLAWWQKRVEPVTPVLLPQVTPPTHVPIAVYTRTHRVCVTGMHAEPSPKRYRLTAPHTGAPQVAPPPHWEPHASGATYLYQ